MSELRRDPVGGRWIIIRNGEEVYTPDDYDRQDNAPRPTTASPFAYGREQFTPPEVDVIRPPDTRPNTPGWQVRVVSNKFPALKIEGNLDRRGLGLYDMSNGVGAHEVVIETPDPLKQMADMSAEELQQVLRMYQSRCISLAKDKRFKYIMVFKNFGVSAGTSIDHAHSQIIALPMVPKLVQEKLDGSREYFAFRGRNVYQDILQQEFEEEERIVAQNDHFLAFCPFVPRYSFECWILPKKSDSRFIQLSGEEQYHLARILKETLWRLKECLGNPAYNFYLHISPVNYEFEETFLWHVEIVPQLTRVAGFEWATGMYVVYTPPEQAAKYLRDVVYSEK